MRVCGGLENPLRRRPITGCAPLGGTPGFVPGAAPFFATPVCYWQYTQFDALTEKEDRYQLYAEMNAQLGDSIQFHLEVPR